MTISRHPRKRAAQRGAGVIACILALAIGGHWALLQATAWATMLARFSGEASLSVALSKTFDGEHPCSICKFVQKGKQQEEQRKTTFASGDDLKLGLPPNAETIPESTADRPGYLPISRAAKRDYPPLRQPPRA